VSAPWKCPECRAWVAPHVTEHRCDPPAAMARVTSISPPGTGGTFAVSAVPEGTTITYNITGTVMSDADLAAAVRRATLGYASHNWAGGRVA